MKAEFLFGDIVIVEDNLIGVVVKTWATYSSAKGSCFSYDVYVRMHDGIRNYQESEIARYRVRHKYLDEEELEWQRG